MGVEQWIFDLVNKRESVRGYLDKEVEKEKIIKIIEAK